MIIKDNSKSVSIPRINIKEFNEFIEEKLDVRTKIERWLQERSIGYYRLIQTNREPLQYAINVEDKGVNFVGYKEESLPEFIKFGNIIGGDFLCSYGRFTSMKGFPKKVDGRFDMRYTKIKNFDGVPELTEISDYAFARCVYLQEVKIPSTVTKIGKHAFYNCSNLTKIEIPESVKEIAENAFEGCTNLKDIPSCNISIEESAYYLWQTRQSRFLHKILQGMAPSYANASELDIRNVNVSDDLIRKISDLDIPQFVLDVIRPLEKDFYSKCDVELYRRNLQETKEDPTKEVFSKDIRMNSLCGYENIANLIYIIPIFLKEKVEINKEYYYRRGDEIIEPLGAYFKNLRRHAFLREYDESNPYIELYVDKIYESANGDAQTFKWLFTKTLIHELAHAVLDNYNSEINYRHVEKISYYTPFGKWREESMANAIALKVIKEFGDKTFYEYAKNYVSTQPAEYALGVLMEDFDYGDLRSVMDNKYEGVSQDLQDEWMKYVQGNPDCEGLKQWNKKLLGLE